MDSNTVRSMTVTSKSIDWLSNQFKSNFTIYQMKRIYYSAYRPMQLCTSIPGSLFSGVCLHLVELNAFPRSLTICPRFTILTKNQEWKINYTCISLSTELPAVNTTTAPIGTAIGPGDVRVPMSGMIILAPGVISPGSPALAGTLTVVSTPQGVVTPAAPPPPPVSAATTVGGTPAATTASRPAPLIATSATPAGGPTLLPGDLAARLQTYGATDRAKYFPSRHPPAYAPNFGHNITEIELLAWWFVILIIVPFVLLLNNRNIFVGQVVEKRWESELRKFVENFDSWIHNIYNSRRTWKIILFFFCRNNQKVQYIFLIIKNQKKTM